MLEIKLSNHAKLRMDERHITKEEVVQALTPPTKITSGKGEKFIATKNGIRVIHVVADKTIVVVTVTIYFP